MNESLIEERLTISCFSDYYLYEIGNYTKKVFENINSLLDSFKYYISIEKYTNSTNNELIEMYKELDLICRIYSKSVVDFEKNVDIDDKLKFIINPISTSGHATVQIIYKNDKNNYEHYFFNSGYYAIPSKHEYKVSDVGELVPFLTCTKSKSTKIIERNLEINRLYMNYLKDYQSDKQFKFFIEMQFQGNCTLRACIYPIFIILKLAKKRENSYIENFLELFRLFIIDRNFDKIFNEKERTYDSIFSNNFLLEILQERINKQYIVNSKKNLLGMVNDLLTKIKDKSKKFIMGRDIISSYDIEEINYDDISSLTFYNNNSKIKNTILETYMKFEEGVEKNNTLVNMKSIVSRRNSQTIEISIDYKILNDFLHKFDNNMKDFKVDLNYINSCHQINEFLLEFFKEKPEKEKSIYFPKNIPKS